MVKRVLALDASGVRVLATARFLARLEAELPQPLHSTFDLVVGISSGAALSGLLSAVNPFGIWFWLVLIIGLSVTAQLRGWKVWVTCCFFWLAAVGVRTIIAVASVSGSTST